MRGLGELQRTQMKHRDARIFALCEHLRSAVDILEQIVSEPFEPPVKETPPPVSMPAPMPPPPPALSPERLFYTQNEVSTALGIGRTSIWRYIREGKFPAVKIGSRTMIPAEPLRAWIAALPSRRRTKT